EKGTAIHKIMQYIEFSKADDIEGEIERLIEWKYITEKEGRIADVKKITAFFQSELFLRILKSQAYYREMKFLTEVNAGEVYDVSADLFDKKVIVQGAVDLLFVEDNKIVIVDFKTDRVEDSDTLVERYSEQLRLYSVACSKKFKMPVKEKIIYSFNLSKDIKL
ncbi:MAG TPA: helicase-exonuclease AddAB subunit AddA, partial [Ruminococcaceae bacterium]|nr:helicase-exonuclease AddAB subunit AddA [Oscillospiraceae bacterium]